VTGVCQTAHLIESVDDVQELQKLEAVAFHKPHVAALQGSFVQQVLADGRFRSGGEFSRKATSQLEQLTGAKKVFLTNSCTSALEVSAMALKFQPGDEVIVPSFTFAGTATAFSRAGAKIVICDVDPKTMMMDVDLVSKVLSSRTRAVVPVHYAGHAVDMQPIMELANSLNITVIEDAAQGLGASRNGLALGSIGHFGCYSFHETKVAHCGHGGALIVNQCDSETLKVLETCINRGTNFANFRQEGASHYEWTGQGGCFDLGELPAAVISAQLAELQDIISLRLEIVAYYARQLDKMGLTYLSPDVSSTENGHLFALVADNRLVAEQLIKTANACGIAMQSHYKPLHMSKFGKILGYRSADCPGSADMWDRIVRLPIHTHMTRADAGRAVTHVQKALRS